MVSGVRFRVSATRSFQVSGVRCQDYEPDDVEIIRFRSLLYIC
jgi:hypothetical protein